MARKPKLAEVSDGQDALEKIARLLAIQVTREMKQDDASMLLGAIGFSDKEVIACLGVSESYVRQVRFQRARKKRRRA